jgi:hypothetical protein
LGTAGTYSDASELSSVWLAAQPSVYSSRWLWDGESASVPPDFLTPSLGEFVHYTATQNPCSPTLAVPTRILDINGVWKDCTPAVQGFWDPPSALTPGNGFRTLGALESSRKSPCTVEAVPGATPYLVLASITHDPDKGPASFSTNNPNSVGPRPANEGPAANKSPPPNIPASETGSLRSDAIPSVTGSSQSSNGDIHKYIIGSITLARSSPTKISGLLISLLPDGSRIVIDGETQPISDFLATV